MKRTPIVVPGQVYLHTDYNDYLVVTKVNRGEITFKGPGFGGINELEMFLTRFGPVDPLDLDTIEAGILNDLLEQANSKASLLMGWVTSDDDEFDDED